jgi:hypothetical protein
MDYEHQETHEIVRNAIARLTDPNNHPEEKEEDDERRHVLLCGLTRSTHHYLSTGVVCAASYVGFLLDNHGDASHDEVVRITELELVHMIISRLSRPSDGGLDVLRNFFSRSDTKFTKVTLFRCKFWYSGTSLATF